MNKNFSMLLAKFSSIDTEIFGYVATSVTHVEKRVSLTNLANLDFVSTICISA